MAGDAAPPDGWPMRSEASQGVYRSTDDGRPLASRASALMWLISLALHIKVFSMFFIIMCALGLMLLLLLLFLLLVLFLLLLTRYRQQKRSLVETSANRPISRLNDQPIGIAWLR